MLPARAATRSSGWRVESSQYGVGSAGSFTATFTDPFGNVLGVMYNPHYVEMVEAQRR